MWPSWVFGFLGPRNRLPGINGPKREIKLQMLGFMLSFGPSIPCGDRLGSRADALKHVRECLPESLTTWF